MEQNAEKNWMMGYHVATQDRAQAILNGADFYDSTSDDAWLGRGVYFWYYLAHAEWWMQYGRNRNGPLRAQTTQNLMVRLEYEDGQLLDLDNPDDWNLMDEVVREFFQVAGTSDLPTAANFDSQPWEKRVCSACNLLKNTFPEIGIIVYTFFPKKVPPSRSGIRYNQRQICVSNHTLIAHVEAVPKGMRRRVPGKQGKILPFPVVDESIPLTDEAGTLDT